MHPDESTADPQDPAFVGADCRYLMITAVPWHQHPDGSVWVEELWHRDLVRHLDYLGRLVVLAPRLPFQAGADLVRVAPSPALTFRPLPWGTSLAGALMRAPATILATLREVRQADMVHSGVAGWPIPPGAFANPLAVLWRKPLIIMVESAFWRLAGPGPHGLASRLRAAVVEALARWSVRHAALSVFTHAGYQASLAPDRLAQSLVTPASWIDAGDVLSPAEADRAWDAKTGPVRVLLAARLTEAKGIAVLLEALQGAAADGLAGVDVIGDGPLRPAVAELATRLGPGRLRLLDPVPYGAPFFGLLGGYHAVLVPSISDEQPRILFDAAAQALPLLVSDTEGHRGLVEAGVTGWLHPAGSPAALADTLRRAADRPGDLRRMGLAARDWSEGRTHQAMHQARARRLADLWRARKAVRAS